MMDKIRTMEALDPTRAPHFRVEASTRAEVAYVKLKEAILLGYIPAGAALVEHEIVDLMGISRTPIRAAYQRLAYDGLVKIHSYRGAFVRDLDVTEAQEGYEVRAALEAKAVQLAASRASNADLQILWDTYITSDIGANWLSDEQTLKRQNLHLAIAELSGNNDLRIKIEHQINLIALWRNKARRDGVIYRDTRKEHADLVKAILQRDVEEARAMIETHIERSWSNSIESKTGGTT